ncbi:MAG: hypothetical protein GTN53_43645, partial [Candidatus Aminicenantes bacterium]|nr:hypothetical protein [Candidatus Aminicenantes bacterium]NIT29412.1 hypothetical protein [Candidatus Aminicenantes bacterium]
LKNSGTVVGQRASEEVIALSELLEKTGEKNIATVTNATRAFSMDVAHAASGFLTGIVDSINKVSKD